MSEKLIFPDKCQKIWCRKFRFVFVQFKQSFYRDCPSQKSLAPFVNIFALDLKKHLKSSKIEWFLPILFGFLGADLKKLKIQVAILVCNLAKGRWRVTCRKGFSHTYI